MVAPSEAWPGWGWEALRRSPFIEHQVEGWLTRLPDFDPGGAEQSATAARDLLARIGALDLDALPPVLSVPLRKARYGAQARAKEDDWYSTATDPAETASVTMCSPWTAATARARPRRVPASCC